MSESVEQAALRRAERDELPAPWGSVLAAMEASERLNDSRYRHLTETRDAMYDEIAELRDALLAVTNRIEACFGALDSLHRDTSAALRGIGDQLGVDV